MVGSTADNTISRKQSYALSLRVRMLYCLAVPAMILTLLIMSPLCVALLPILALPTVWLMWQWNASDRDKAADLQTMIWIYVISGTAGTLVVLLIQAMFSYLFAIVLFQSQLHMYLEELAKQQNAHLDTLQFSDPSNERLGDNLSYQWQYFLFLALTCYVTVAITEEGLKYCSLVYVRRYHAAVQRGCIHRICNSICTRLQHIREYRVHIPGMSS